MVWGESVSALRLPDAPNIMFNDINFLLNGPRFDSRCEEEARPSLLPSRRGERKRNYTRENNLRDEERNVGTLGVAGMEGREGV